MDRRFFSFLIASTAFLLIYMSLRVMLVPLPKPKPDGGPGLADVDGGLGNGGLGDAEAIVAAADDADPDNPVGGEPVAIANRPERPVWSTLGSMDAATGHVMLVTLNSRGAGVERIELTERKGNGRLKYRRVDVRSGYLGYFAADPLATELGVRINVVGPGTPAALAVCADGDVGVGLQPGDLITAIDQMEIVSLSQMEAAMTTTQPDDDVSITVVRGGDGQDDLGSGEAVQKLTFTTTLSEHPLDLLRLSSAGGEDEIAGNLSRLSCLMTVSRVGRKEILPGETSLLAQSDPTDLIWTITDAAVGNAEAAQSIGYRVELSDAEMKAAGGGAVALSRSYSVTPGSYVLGLDVKLDNLADKPQKLAYRLEGVNGVTLEGWWYSNKKSPNWTGSAARDVIYRTAADGHNLISGFSLLKMARKESEPDAQVIFAPDSGVAASDLKYIGVDAQYFTVAYLPEDALAINESFDRAAAMVLADPAVVEKHKERAVNASFFLDAKTAELPAGGSMGQSLRMFAGPKQSELMAAVGLSDCIYYGWPVFAVLSKLLGSLLHVLSGVGNYAVAIVLLTLIVRACMFPLSRKAAMNAQRMQELAPEMKKITDKYKDDMEARIKAQRELQQRVGFNPMAGCLPMFMQLPIFVGLYSLLSVDIELRQAAFAPWTSWASNLAAPDMLAYWGDWMWGYMSGRGTGWLGPYFNVLPMLVVALFLAQQKMFMPPATDEQTAMTQKMMNYMTLFMGLFFFRVPAGLCIYFITSSLWGICERILVKKTLPNTPHFDPSVLEGRVNKDGGSGGSKGGGKGDGGDSSGPSNGQSPGSGGGQMAGVTANGSGKSWSDKIKNRINPETPAAPLPKDRKRPAPGKKRR